MPFLKWQNGFDKTQSCQSWKYKSVFIKNECCILFPLVYLVTDMTSQVANLLNVSNVKLELIKQNVDWYIAICFRLKTVNICLQSFLSSRLSPSNPAVWEYSLCFIWSESDCPLGWGSRLYSFRVMPCLSDNYTIYCLSWSGCDIIAGYVFKRQSRYFSTVTFSGSVYVLDFVLVAGLWKNRNVLTVLRFLYFQFTFKSNFLFVIFSEKEGCKWQVTEVQPSLQWACSRSAFSDCRESGRLETADPFLHCFVAFVFIFNGKCHFWFSSYLNPLCIGCLRNYEVMSWTKTKEDVFQLLVFCPGTGKCLSPK